MKLPKRKKNKLNGRSGEKVIFSSEHEIGPIENRSNKLIARRSLACAKFPFNWSYILFDESNQYWSKEEEKTVCFQSIYSFIYILFLVEQFPIEMFIRNRKAYLINRMRIQLKLQVNCTKIPKAVHEFPIARENSVDAFTN